MSAAPAGPQAVLIDTDVFSVLHRGSSPRAARFRPLVDGRIVLVSFATVGELWRGALLDNWGTKKRADLQREIDRTTVLPYDEAVVIAYAEITAHAVNNALPLGQPAHSNDAWIAATARAHALPLLTGNVRHFRGADGVVLIDPGGGAGAPSKGGSGGP